MLLKAKRGFLSNNCNFCFYKRTGYTPLVCKIWFELFFFYFGTTRDENSAKLGKQWKKWKSGQRHHTGKETTKWEYTTLFQDQGNLLLLIIKNFVHTISWNRILASSTSVPGINAYLKLKKDNQRREIVNNEIYKGLICFMHSSVINYLSCSFHNSLSLLLILWKRLKRSSDIVVLKLTIFLVVLKSWTQPWQIRKKFRVQNP